MKPRIVITGMGAVTPSGANVQETWTALCSGRSAVRRITRFDATGFPVSIGAEAQDPGSAEAWLASRGQTHLLTQVHDLKGRLALAALREALDQSGLEPVPRRPERIAVCMGSEAARPDLAVIATRMRAGALPAPEELAALAPDAPTRLFAAVLGAQGPRSTTSTACTSSSQAIGEALLALRRGDADVAVAGGVDVLIDPIMVTGFSRLGALSTRNATPDAASRPFDRNRDGFVLGEGAGVLVLETEAHARARGADILAELSGFGCSCNAWRITDSPPDGRGARQAMEAALTDARLAPSAVGYINAHGTYTSMNDSSETAGIHRALGSAADQAWVSSTKSMMGHLVAACGAVEAIVCTQAVRSQAVPPGINLDEPDPACALRHVGSAAREVSLNHALTNAFGFGGSNGSLVLSRWTG